MSEPMRASYDCSTGEVVSEPLSAAEKRQRKDDESAARETAFDLLRTERNGRLAASDWTQGGDAPLDEKARSAWSSYRQALRDLPAKTKDPFDPSWPSPPK